MGFNVFTHPKFSKMCWVGLAIDGQLTYFDIDSLFLNALYKLALNQYQNMRISFVLEKVIQQPVNSYSRGCWFTFFDETIQNVDIAVLILIRH